MHPSTGKTQLSLPMFDKLPEANSATLTSSSVASHARTFHKLVSVLDWKANALVYGGTSADLLARLDRVLLCWKMLQQLLGMGEVELKLLRRLPDWGTAQHGALYRLVMPELRTNANDGSVWATPMAADTQNRQLPDEETIHVTQSGTLKYVNPTGKSQVRLSQSVKYYEQKQDWYTPIANDALKAGAIEQKRENGLSAQVQWATPRARDFQPESLNSAENRHSANLTSQVMWATPTVNTSKNNAAPSQWERNSQPLDVQVQVSREKVQPLNPAWVEMLMGYPPGWTALD